MAPVPRRCARGWWPMRSCICYFLFRRSDIRCWKRWPRRATARRNGSSASHSTWGRPIRISAVSCCSGCCRSSVGRDRGWRWCARRVSCWWRRPGQRGGAIVLIEKVNFAADFAWTLKFRDAFGFAELWKRLLEPGGVVFPGIAVSGATGGLSAPPLRQDAEVRRRIRRCNRDGPRSRMSGCWANGRPWWPRWRRGGPGRGPADRLAQPGGLRSGVPGERRGELHQTRLHALRRVGRRHVRHVSGIRPPVRLQGRRWSRRSRPRWSPGRCWCSPTSTRTSGRKPAQRIWEFVGQRREVMGAG